MFGVWDTEDLDEIGHCTSSDGVGTVITAVLVLNTCCLKSER
jgi:hypothetical protein